jgi:transcriptional regulator with XRE-family HTH domain
MAFGDVIREERKRQKMSQKELASRVEKEKNQPISPQYLNDIELNRRIPSPPIIEQLAQRLKLDADRLYPLANQFPPNVNMDRQDPARIQEAMKAFRTTLRK